MILATQWDLLEWRLAIVLFGFAALTSCTIAPPNRETKGAVPAPPSETEGSLESREARLRIVVLGDSLTAGLGVSPEDAYPAKLQARVNAAGYAFEVVNAGVSGDTTAGGLRRLDWSLAGGARILIVALGANDGLRGLPVEQMKANLEAVITYAIERGVEVLLAGMEAPPNFGGSYVDGFRAVFHDLAAKYNIVFLPFLLEGVAGVPELNQPDGIHPNAQGADRVAAYLWVTLEPMLARKVDDVDAIVQVPRRM